MDTQKISKKLLFFNMCLFLSCLSMVFVIYDTTHSLKLKDIAVKKEYIVFSEVSISAHSAIVYDLSTKDILYKKNETVQMPLASLTKLVTALTAYDLAPKNTKIVIRPEFLSEEGDSGLQSGEKWQLSDLIDFSLVVSSNDGARSVASAIGAIISTTSDFSLGRKDFIEKMNDETQKLGLSQTYFYNETGLDISTTQSGGYGSALDVVKLLEYILKNKPDILEATKYSKTKISSENKIHTAQNTNTDINKITGLIASKTGYTELAGGNLAVVYDLSIGHPVAVVVLGSTEGGRFGDVLTLIKALKYDSK